VAGGVLPRDGADDAAQVASGQRADTLLAQLQGAVAVGLQCFFLCGRGPQRAALTGFSAGKESARHPSDDGPEGAH
jgi:hypothetical protein